MGACLVAGTGLCEQLPCRAEEIITLDCGQQTRVAPQNGKETSLILVVSGAAHVPPASSTRNMDTCLRPPTASF